MIANAQPLRDEWTPTEIYHREGQIQQISSALKPIQHDLGATDVLITGPSGSGKTTLAKYLVRQLAQEVLGVEWGYVNCISESTKSGIVYTLAREAGRASDLRLEGTPTSIFFERIREIDDHFVAVLDEVDVLEDELTIQALHDLPNVTLILVCVSEDTLFADLDSRVASRIRAAEKVRLDKYHHEEIVDILQGRIDAALLPDTVAPEAVETMADLSAGDARTAIALLRRSVRHVDQADHDTITAADVEAIEDDAREEIRERHVDTLGTHQRHLYEIIRDAGEISASDLHATYEERVADPKAKSSRRRYLKSLERYDLVVSHGATRGKRYELVTH